MPGDLALVLITAAAFLAGLITGCIVTAGRYIRILERLSREAADGFTNLRRTDKRGGGHVTRIR